MMATPAGDGGNEPLGRITAKSTTDPVLRNALRYTISAKEYQTLHKYIISRSKLLKRNSPTVSQVEKLVEQPGRDDHNAAAVRASLRVFLASSVALKAWAMLNKRLLGRDVKSKVSLWRSPNFRLSLSLSVILLFHRLLFRFFTRLRAHLLTPDAQPFRKRNPRTSRTLTSRFAPAVGASLAGFLLGIYPSDELRITIAIYALSRAAEVTYNLAEDQGLLWGKKGSKFERPWWWGSWLLMPLSCGQLHHAFIFDRDCLPKERFWAAIHWNCVTNFLQLYGDFMLKLSPQYVQKRPDEYQAHLPWPTTYEIVDSLAEISRLNCPPFISPILFPDSTTLPPSLSSISPITSPAHPSITSLNCALLHPGDPSCLRTYLSYWIEAFPKFVRFFGVLYAVFSIPRYKSFYNAPVTYLDKLGRSVLRTSAFLTGVFGTTWGAICLFQQILPRKMLPTQRFFLGGFLGGLWAFIDKETGRANFLYNARLSLKSLWNVGLKRGWWKGVKGGDVWLFVAALATLNAVYTKDVYALRSSSLQTMISGLRGEGAASIKDRQNDHAENIK